MTTAQLLWLGRELLSDPDDWGREPFAEDANGQSVGIVAVTVRRWGPQGALLMQASDLETYRAAVRALLASLPGPAASGPRPTRDLWEFNRSASHGEVLGLFDRASRMVSRDASPFVRWLRRTLKLAA